MALAALAAAFGSAWPEALGPFVEGAFRAGGAPLGVEDPSTGTPLAEVAACDAATLERAAAAARRAFDSGPWPRTPAYDRGRLLERIALAIEAQAEPLSRLEALDAGKPLAAVRREVAGAAKVFHYYAGAMDKLYGETIPVAPSLLDFTLREPIGVAAQIVPWNFPLLACAWKLAPALAAGCCCLLKPSPLTPLSALVLAALCREAGLPEGVLAVLPGGAELGAALVARAEVDAVAFTGSTAVGTRVMQAAAVGVRPVALELGGKNPFLVFDDADVEAAAASAVSAAFGNAGQSCSARSVVLVAETLHDAFVEAFVVAAGRLRAGPVLDEATTLGPLISEAHRARVRGFLEADGSAARRPVALPLPEVGWYEAPTVFAGVEPGSPLLREEIFGPVAAVARFADPREAVALANAGDYGLNATIWTRDLERALSTARDLRCGMVSINGQTSASSQALFAPFGGYRQSGIGRELGRYGLEFYTEVKNIAVLLPA
ncbi:betaine-aldehyde dehydrogenase [Tistlia consotensis]|uniref:Betaine-aldehyde dehydrogenase n=1 Tax=Tistlia consotensis USBA 355 TaxID=560819 RepID=A0A1Y6C744_9PROT|nr:aldehyde dehydrogenase family protein [Tistlia consotensis]SMF48651.1 betaine-aldehyde dehydrogenase [Tistlia consotensis USBA 355]SNR80940.1 betaine-aldehyde dehydrogenase [Tistlia consotensis]